MVNSQYPLLFLLVIVNVIVNVFSLHAVFETFYSFAKTLHELGYLFPAEE